MAITSQIKGKLLHAKCASFQDDQNQTQTYGKIQLIVPDMSGEFDQIQNIKVKKEDFGFLPDLQKNLGKEVSLNLETNEYKGRVSYYYIPARNIEPNKAA